MKSLVLSAIALGAAVAPALASDLKVVNAKNIPLKPRSKLVATPGKYANKNHIKRAGTDQADLSNQIELYVISLLVGSPAQNITVQIDTGSSDLWFPQKGSTLCAEAQGACEQLGSYDPTASHPKELNQAFEIEYGDGTQIRGDFVQDTVQVGSATLTAVQFARCTGGSSSTGIQGILGIGYQAGEATAEEALAETGSENGAVYANTLADMVSQGVINSLAYSMWLNDPNSADGNVLFGGVDSAKYSGTLVSMPVVPDSEGGGYDRLNLPLTAISFSADGQSFTFTDSSFASPALIDSGTTLMFLPTDVAESLFNSLGATVTSDGQAFLPCAYGNDGTAKMTFQFNGANGASIDVLLNDLLLSTGQTFNGQEYCVFLVEGGGPDGLVILGDSFMRSAYLTYDLTNNMIAIAQAKFNVTDTNIKEISSSGIPGASVMSTLVGGLASQSAAATVIPNGGGELTATSFANTATTALEHTASVPSFAITGTSAPASTASHKNAASAVQSPLFSVVGVLAGTVTLMSFLGGAMMIWV